MRGKPQRAFEIGSFFYLGEIAFFSIFHRFEDFEAKLASMQMPNIYTKPNPGLCDLEHFL